MQYKQDQRATVMKDVTPILLNINMQQLTDGFSTWKGLGSSR